MSSDTKDCPYWRGGYCVADKACKLHHDPAKGGHHQETYLAQLAAQEGGPASQPRPVAYPTASAMASALYGGGQPMVFGYGYYPQMVPVMPAMGPPRNYKTVQCRHFLRGHCMRGDACGFRHGEEQITTASAASFGQLPAELANPVHPGRPFRVVTCRRWVQGTCTHGDRCTFRHDFDSGSAEFATHPARTPESRPDNVLTAPSETPDGRPDNAAAGVKRALSPSKTAPPSAEDQTSKLLKLSPSDAQ